MNLKTIISCFLAILLVSCSIESQPTTDNSQLNTKKEANKKHLSETQTQISAKEADLNDNLTISVIDNSILLHDTNIILGDSFNEVQSKLNKQLLKSPISDTCFLVTIDNSLSLEFFNDELIFMSVFSGDNISTDKGLSLDDTFETLSTIYPDLTKSEDINIGGDESSNSTTISYSTNHNLRGDYMVFILTDDNKVDDIGVYNINKDNDICEVY